MLTERLPPVSVDGEIPNLRIGDQNVNFAPQDPEAATMEIDNETGADNNRSVNSELHHSYKYKTAFSSLD